MGAQYIMASSECSADEPHQYKVNAQTVAWTLQVGGNVTVTTHRSKLAGQDEGLAKAKAVGDCAPSKFAGHTG